MRTEIERLLADNVGRPALSRALAAMVERLGYHPAEPVGDGRLYVELSISYLSIRSEVSLATAHTAWHLLRGLVGWDSIRLSEVRRLGLSPRRRAHGERWGQHLLVDSEIRSACRMVATPRDSAQPLGEVEWRPVEGIRRRAARCPWHDDRRPSAIWNLDEGGRTACLVCMVCRDSSDRPLVALAERSGDGGWRARLSARTLRGSAPTSSRMPTATAIETLQVCSTATSSNGADSVGSAPLGEASSKTRTVDELPATSRRGEVLLGRLSTKGMSRRASARSDVLSILRDAEARSGDRDWGSAIVAAEQDEPSVDHPDRLVSVQEMRPIEWRSVGRYSRPSRWRPISQRWALVDLDGLSESLSVREDVDSFVDRVERIASTDSWLSGGFAVVRTSETGLQVWLELEVEVDPERFARSRSVRLWLHGLGETLADEVEGLGLGRPKVDPTAFESHRYGRRPGWRVKRGRAERATLLAARDAA